MRQLVLLYWGCVFLMYLSQTYYPVETQLDSRQTGKRHFMLRRADVFMIVTILWLTGFSFLRETYNDTSTYIATFRNAQSVVESFADGIFTDWVANPFSMLYRSLLHEFTNNYHIYFLFPAFLNTLAFVKIYKRYSEFPAFSMLIFFSLGTYITYMASLKQSIAMFFLLVSIPYALDKKYLKFLIFVLIAAMFHNYAIMFVIIPLLTEKPWGKITWVLVGVTLFTMATYDMTLGALIEYAESLGAEMHENEIFYDSQLNVLRVLVYWVPGIMALVFNKRLFRNSNRIENLFTNISIVSALFLSLGLVKGANLMGRMAAYFEFAAGISLPWMIKKLFTKQSAQLVTIIATVLYFGYFYYEFAINKDFGSSYSSISLWQFIVSLFGG